MSTQSLKLALNLGGNTEFSLPPYSGSGNANFLAEISDTRYSDNFTYLQTYSADATYNIPDNFGSALLKKSAQEALLNGKFGLVCGDSFIASAQAGAALFVTATINFATASDKINFDSEFKSGISGIGSVVANFSAAVASSKVAGSLTLRALQAGGDPSKLAEIFGKPDEHGNYGIVSCSPQNIESCKSIVNNVISYAQGVFEASVNPSDITTLYFFNASEASYSNYGIDYDLTTLTPKSKSDISKSINLFSHMSNDIDYLDNYKNYILNNPKYRSQFKNPVAVQGDIEKMIKNYSDFLVYGKNRLNSVLDTSINSQSDSAYSDIFNRYQLLENTGYIAKTLSLKTIIELTAKSPNTDKKFHYILLPLSDSFILDCADGCNDISPMGTMIKDDFLPFNYDDKSSLVNTWDYCSVSFDINKPITTAFSSGGSIRNNVYIYCKNPSSSTDANLGTSFIVYHDRVHGSDSYNSGFIIDLVRGDLLYDPYALESFKMYTDLEYNPL